MKNKIIFEFINYKICCRNSNLKELTGMKEEL
jgi:hypothetical protein